MITLLDTYSLCSYSEYYLNIQKAQKAKTIFKYH